MVASATTVRVGVPLTGGALVAGARERGYAVLFSANAFARKYGKGHERAGEFKDFRLPDPAQFAGLDAALDSAGFVAAVKYGDFRWSVEDYYDLVAAHDWTWHAAMDYCCEPETAGDRGMRLLRIGATAHMLAACRREAASRGLPMPMPVLQGWTPEEYAMCARWLPVVEWPALVGIGSVCRRQVHGKNGILAILDAVDKVLPKGTQVHLFGVKSTALAQLAGHPRVASVDSMAWDVQARAERRTGRDMAFRVSHMERWATKQLAIAQQPKRLPEACEALFDPADYGIRVFTSAEDVLLESLAMRYAELLAGGDIEYRAAILAARRDAHRIVAITRTYPDLGDEVLEMLGEVLGDEGAAREALEDAGMAPQCEDEDERTEVRGGAEAVAGVVAVEHGPFAAGGDDHEGGASLAGAGRALARRPRDVGGGWWQMEFAWAVPSQPARVGGARRRRDRLAQARFGPASHVRAAGHAAVLDRERAEAAAGGQGMSRRLKWVVFPGRVRSRTDGDEHYVGAAQLMRLYGVRPQECMVADPVGSRAVYAATVRDADRLGLVPLVPRGDGNYTLPRCCPQCNDGTGRSAFPHYGVAPHVCGFRVARGDFGGSIELPQAQWPANFRPDRESGAGDGGFPGCGVYTHCLACGASNQEG